MVSHAKKNISSKLPLVLGLVLGAFLLFGIIFWMITPDKITANTTYFRVADMFDCQITDEYIHHEDETNTDYLVVNFISSYDGPAIDRKIDQQNTTGYDENTPTSDQLTEEEQENLSNEEIDKINEKTINELNKRLAKKRTMGEFVDVFASQNNRALDEPSDLDREGAGNATNYDSLHKGAESGDSYEFMLVYTLKNFDPVTLTFYPTGSNDVDKEFDIVFNIYQHDFIGYLVSLFNNAIDIFMKQNVHFIDFKAAKINLVDGWYADTEGRAVVRLMNPKYSGATLDINYDTASSAEELAKKTAALQTPVPDVSEMEIAGRTYYYFDKASDSFALCSDGKSGVKLRIIGTGLSLDDARSFIESLEF